MNKNLTSDQLKQLLRTVFSPTANDRVLFILVDVSNERVLDNPGWQERRLLAEDWKIKLQMIKHELHLEEVDLLYYENTGSNNADFPASAYSWSGNPAKVSAAILRASGAEWDFSNRLSEADIVLALTQFSATAPLKILAKKYQFSAVTMPGFSRQMLPALSLDYEQVHAQVMKIKTRLDEAMCLEMQFQVQGKTFQLFVDVRHRLGHASSGLLRERGLAGNLPSGESYIVPYEGELTEASQTRGVLPVQFGYEVVFYEIQNNRAVAVKSQGKVSEKERQKLQAEPAYGNLAEIGFGVLQPFGIKPMGEILLDEKLGLHIAFGRSDHFGGATSPEDFNKPENVVHIDRIYLPEIQGQVMVKEVVFVYPEKRKEVIMRDGQYVF
ncbi:MAG: hypothetical protein ACE5HS_10235 [bacterium]